MSVTLVTGAAGFLGGSCVRALLARGHEVVAVVRDLDPRAQIYSDGLASRCVEVRDDLFNAERIIARYRPRRVLHLAAQSQVPQAGQDPLHTFESNVRAVWLLLEACRRASRPPEAILVASSDKAYGTAPAPYREDTALLPRHPYDASKAASDLLAQSFALHFGLPVVITRAANIYGPGDLNRDRLVPGACMAFTRGDVLRLRSRGEMVREWLYVDDAAAACLHLLERAGDMDNHVFNVGSGERAPAQEVVDRLLHLSGRGHDLVERSDEDPPGELPVQGMDSRRIRATGWAPSTTLAQGLEATWEWYSRWSW